MTHYLINPDMAAGAEALNQTIVIAERIGILSETIPGAVIALSTGLVVTLRELQLYLLDEELGLHE